MAAPRKLEPGGGGGADFRAKVMCGSPRVAQSEVTWSLVDLALWGRDGFRECCHDGAIRWTMASIKWEWLGGQKDLGAQGF